mmetsp:Transcript_122/g.375  ORF Transcript_122/g.375 Transcript_122/m.375 type:complete len:303 (+) Transcript_122:908-1816(+)
MPTLLHGCTSSWRVSELDPLTSPAPRRCSVRCAFAFASRLQSMRSRAGNPMKKRWCSMGRRSSAANGCSRSNAQSAMDSARRQRASSSLRALALRALGRAFTTICTAQCRAISAFTTDGLIAQACLSRCRRIRFCCAHSSGSQLSLACVLACALVSSRRRPAVSVSAEVSTCSAPMSSTRQSAALEMPSAQLLEKSRALTNLAKRFTRTRSTSYNLVSPQGSGGNRETSIRCQDGRKMSKSTPSKCRTMDDLVRKLIPHSSTTKRHSTTHQDPLPNSRRQLVKSGRRKAIMQNSWNSLKADE